MRVPEFVLVFTLAAAGATIPRDSPLPGMPPVLDPHDIYAADHAGDLSPAARRFPPRIYVPNNESNTPSYDLRTLWVLLARIPVGHGPHGLCLYPQPGRYSLGHTGVFR